MMLKVMEQRSGYLCLLKRCMTAHSKPTNGEEHSDGTAGSAHDPPVLNNHSNDFKSHPALSSRKVRPPLAGCTAGVEFLLLHPPLNCSETRFLLQTFLTMSAVSRRFSSAGRHELRGIASIALWLKNSSSMTKDRTFDHDYFFELAGEGAGCPIKWAVIYFTPCL
jgi:hypothetical protein